MFAKPLLENLMLDQFVDAESPNQNETEAEGVLNQGQAEVNENAVPVIDG